MLTVPHAPLWLVCHRPCAAMALAALALGGCGPAGPARVPQPAFSPTAVTRSVMALADRDHNGECTLEELAVVPGLALEEAISDLDRDKNGRLSENEILDWLTALRQTKVAVATASVRISQRGEPLPGVRVQIIPEACMGDTSLAAEGKTDNSGITTLRIPSLPLGAHFGIYRLTITGRDTTGQPLGAQFNSESKLGLIVPLNAPIVKFDLE